jgi:nucleoside-triphosphatase
MSASAPPKIFLTGLPGCGKTTLIKGIAHRFAEHVTGFFTEEVREAKGRRIGFDLVSHTGERAAFARKGGGSRKRVGPYSVFLDPLENWGLELLKPSPDHPLVILDEVGKMECLSKVFQQISPSALGIGCPPRGRTDPANPRTRGSRMPRGDPREPEPISPSARDRVP